MTNYSADVTDGNATLTIPTTGMKKGKYKILTEYNQNDKYQSSNTQSYLTLNETSWNIIDTTPTSTQWTKTPSSDGIHSTLNQYVTCNVPLPDNITIRVHGTSNSTQGGIELRDLPSNNKSSLSFNNHNGIRKWGQIGNGLVANLVWNTGEFTLELTKNNGAFTFDLDGSTGSFNINSDKLNNNYLSFYVNNGEMIIDRVEWKPNE